MAAGRADAGMMAVWLAKSKIAVTLVPYLLSYRILIIGLRLLPDPQALQWRRIFLSTRQCPGAVL
jgi:hypothetical protein